MSQGHETGFTLGRMPGYVRAHSLFGMGRKLVYPEETHTHMGGRNQTPNPRGVSKHANHQGTVLTHTHQNKRGQFCSLRLLAIAGCAMFGI